jgi:two-component system, chemotaxis family, CheB/CheR fusion protein
MADSHAEFTSTRVNSGSRVPEPMTHTTDSALVRKMLEHLQQFPDLHSTVYKPASLVRRVTRRMLILDLPDVESYFDYLRTHPDELAILADSIRVKVTSFFRDREVWDYMADRVVPDLANNGRPLRIWSAGCASGEEAYTVAMLFAERLGLSGLGDRLRIHGTDVDENALIEARQARYSAGAVAGVPDAFLDKYFERDGTRYAAHRDVRAAVVFDRHDLIHDPPICRIDLLVCRNTLMYFTADAQRRLVSRFFSSLNPAGYVLLGRPELLHDERLFAAVALKERVFRSRVPAEPDA